jgi:pantoate--beta-alanine ligase
MKPHGPAPPVVETDPVRIRELVVAARRAGRRVGFVPTMGALHAGHASLVERAAAECDDVVVSIFVNPKQFGPREDLDRYPRTLAADVALVGGKGARWVFAPEASTAYPAGHATSVVVAAPAADFEGAVRPGHFSGVATVVCWLFQVVPADVAYFGAKDWQQTVVVRRMVADLAIPIDVEVCPTIREPDGLAMSSRNAYLSPDERRRAVALHEGLQAAAARWREGAEIAVVEEAIRAALLARDIAVDYARVVDPDTLLAPGPGTAAVALVAGRLGATRLLDNILLPPRV